MLKKMIYSILIFIFGCASYSSDVKFCNLTRNFFHDKTISERKQQFTNYSLDEQYQLYIFGNQVVHPPATYLASSFAKQGPIIVPFLKVKLNATQNDVTVRDIVLIFVWLSRLKLYDFSKDKELMSLLDQRANSMHGIWGGTTLEMISEIRSVQ